MIIPEKYVNEHHITNVATKSPPISAERMMLNIQRNAGQKNKTEFAFARSDKAQKQRTRWKADIVVGSTVSAFSYALIASW